MVGFKSLIGQCTSGLQGKSKNNARNHLSVAVRTSQYIPMVRVGVRIAPSQWDADSDPGNSDPSVITTFEKGCLFYGAYDIVLTPAIGTC